MQAGLDPVKINVVVMRGVNDDEILDLARFGRDRGVTMRFIEWMPLGADQSWRSGAVVSQEEIVAAVGAEFPVEPLVGATNRPSASPTRTAKGEIEIYPSVTRPVLRLIDRIRLTADGQLQSCLAAVDLVDLRALVGDGESSDDDVAGAVQRCVAGKWAGHMIGQVTFVRPRRSMSQIGG